MDNAVYSLSEESIEICESYFREAWSDMLRSNVFYDTVLRTEDGGMFNAHKCVLSLCSLYFKVVFSSRINTEDQKIFTIPGVTAKVLERIIEYAYTGYIFLTMENVTAILVGADQFMVLELLKDCCDFLLSNLTTKNCIFIREFAKDYFCFQLEDAAYRFLLKHFVDVSQQSEEFLQLSLEEIEELLNSDHIHIKSEEQVWEAGVRWMDYRPDERSYYSHRILRCVRLGLLDTQFFMENVKSHKYIENNDSCKQIVIETLRFLWDLEMIDQKTEAMETPFLATPRIPNSVLFAIGGWSVGSPTGLIEAYDTKADRWVQIDEADPSGPRAYHKLAVIGHNIYVIGGFNGNEYFSSCRCFSVVTKKWKDIAPMHCKRCYVSVAVLDNLIYAMGGYNGHHRQNTAERYDYHTNQWTFIEPMNVQRSDACATTLNGLIYIVGGFNGTECLPSCEFYNPSYDQWTTVTSMRQRRSGVSVIGYHGKIYALGGFNGISRLSNGERFDPENEEWSEIPDMFNPRSNFAIEIVDDLIFAIGGFNGVTTIFHVECFDDHKNEWYEATDMNYFRSALAACVVSDIPNINDYIHQNRRGLMEEKRQKLLQQRNLHLERQRLNEAPLPVFRPQILPRMNDEEI